MFNIFKTVIETGRFNLSDILKKIESNWVQGKLSDTEKADLIDLAQQKAKAENSVDLLKKIYELEKRVKALEDSATPDESVEEYPEYVAGKWYYNGNKMTFNGAKYECVAPEGVVCVWNPEEHPSYWKLVE
jgi:hypothetical protein